MPNLHDKWRKIITANQNHLGVTLSGPAIIELLSDLDETDKELEELKSKLSFTQQWNAERFARIEEYAKANNTWPDIAAIFANGTVGATEPPSYAQLLNTTKHRVEYLLDALLSVPEEQRTDKINKAIEFAERPISARYGTNSNIIQPFEEITTLRADLKEAQDLIRILQAPTKNVKG